MQAFYCSGNPLFLRSLSEIVLAGSLLPYRAPTWRVDNRKKGWAIGMPKKGRTQRRTPWAARLHTTKQATHTVSKQLCYTEHPLALHICLNCYICLEWYTGRREYTHSAVTLCVLKLNFLFHMWVTLKRIQSDHPI